MDETPLTYPPVAVADLPPHARRVYDLLRDEFPDAEEICAMHVGGDRHAFKVEWSGFDEMDHFERQQRVWDRIGDTLPPDSVLKTSVIYLIAPSDFAG